MGSGVGEGVGEGVGPAVGESEGDGVGAGVGVGVGDCAEPLAAVPLPASSDASSAKRSARLGAAVVVCSSRWRGDGDSTTGNAVVSAVCAAKQSRRAAASCQDARGISGALSWLLCHSCGESNP